MQNLPKDIEKAISSEESSQGDWSLEDTLRGAKEADLEAGIKQKHIGVIWQDLTVRGIGGVKNYVKVFPQAFVDFFNVPGTIMSIFGIGKKGREFNILNRFRGVVKPGEMVLVLGRPGSGCTTFLKVISNQRYGFTGIEGEVLYGPFDAETFAKKYRGEALYNMEDDVHHPTLTVGQTLGFALDTKTPGTRPAGLSKAEFKDRVIKTLLKMFNIEHTINTIVGNPFMRGVSGGERKRVSIAEMMVVGATVCAWDNTTRGLDASTALDYAKSLRVLTNIYKTTTFVSLYQASENIYQQFDKVMVIDNGHQVFFGKTSEARAYFEGLGFLEKPRQTTPDYLTGCTDEFEREYKPGRGPENAPSDPASFVKAFEESTVAKGLAQEMTDYRASIKEQKQLYDDFPAGRFAIKTQARAKVQCLHHSILLTDLGTHATTVLDQMAGQVLSCGQLDHFNHHRNRCRYCLATITTDISRCIHSRWRTFHLPTLQRVPSIQRTCKHHAGQTDRQQTPRLHIPSAQCFMDWPNPGRSSIFSYSNLRVQRDCVFHVWSSPERRRVFHFCTCNCFRIPGYDSVLPNNRMPLP